MIFSLFSLVFDVENIIKIISKNGKLWRTLKLGKMSSEHHKFFEKIFSNLQIWKIMGAAMGDPNVLHHKQMLPKHFQCVIISLGIR